LSIGINTLAVGINPEVKGCNRNFIAIDNIELRLPVAVANPSKGEIHFNY
jgi:hypothetical protein